MSIYLEFPSIEDYPIYSAAADTRSNDDFIPALPFNWLRTLEFSASSLMITDLDDVLTSKDDA